MTRVQVHLDFGGLDRFEKAVYDGVNDGVTAAARTLSAEMAGIMGRNQTAIGVPSRPGEPPNVQTARLRSSIDYTKAERLTARAGTNVDYGAHLEYGTSKMAARPWARPALLMANNSGKLARSFLRSATASIRRRAAQ